MSVYISDGKNDKHVNLNPSRKGIFLKGFSLERRDEQ